MTDNDKKDELALALVLLFDYKVQVCKVDFNEAISAKCETAEDLGILENVKAMTSMTPKVTMRVRED